MTPFVSQLRQLQATGQRRDVVLVYVAASDASELAFRDELAARQACAPSCSPATSRPPCPRTGPGLRGRVWTPIPSSVPFPTWPARHAFISGPPRLIADLAPALQKARSLTTDAFAGY
ncbi:hypothetical protein JM654_01720 [Microbacterium oxydans]|nr:hypothetical protein [Microbacterium oxydans]